MKKGKKKIISILIIILCVISLGVNIYAHQGRTDANGGHKDNKNKSGLGNYHYHCGGHEAHLHPNGVCPYSANSNTSSSSDSNSTTSTKPVSVEPVVEVIVATGIEINETIEEIEIGDNITLTATITPSNVSDKDITWKSRDENVATINEDGELFVKQAGTVEIIATTSNGKTSSIIINVKEEPQEANNIIVNEQVLTSENIVNNVEETTSQENSDALAGMATIGLIGGGYLAYKKYKG